MKTTKKLLAIFLAVLMLTALLPNVMAEDGGYTITISLGSGDTQKETHTYQAYQIFAGTLSSDGKKLTEITWGSGVNGSAVLAALNGSSDSATYADAAAVAEALSRQSDETGYLDVSTFENAVAANLSSTVAGTSKETAAPYTITGLSAGYYLVKDSEDSMDGKQDAYTAFILEVVKDVPVTTKASVPTVKKKVIDTNDSKANSTSGWQDSADHDIGDSIQYQITGTLPSTYSSYDSYKYIFTDTICKGLTVDVSSVVVTVGGQTVTAGDDTYKVETASYSGSDSTYSGGTVMTISFDNLKNVTKTTGAGDVVVTYNATLNSDAVIGSAGNPNKVDLTFSNNPNVGGAGDTGKTPEDKVIVFTYQMVVKKVDENEKPLKDAVFTLYKYDAKTSDYTIEKGTGTVNISDTDTSDSVDDTGTVFTWKGLDDGDYKLVETTAPDGYNKMDPIKFTVTADHQIDSDDPRLNSLTGTITDGTAKTFDSGSLTATIENKPGNTLPSTGGVGTTIFYVVGSVLAIGAFILLVAKKRASRA